MKRLAAAMCFALMACSGSFPVDDESVGRARSESDIVVLGAALDRAERWHVESDAVRWDTQLEAMTEDIEAVAGIHAKYNAGCQFPYYVE